MYVLTNKNDFFLPRFDFGTFGRFNGGGGSGGSAPPSGGGSGGGGGGGY